MIEYTEIFDIVLYFNRKVFVKPKKTTFLELQKNNPMLNIDEILDIFSDLNIKYEKDLNSHESLENKDLVISACVLIPEDKNFIKNCKLIEKDSFFIEWTKSSKKLMDETIVKLLNI